MPKASSVSCADWASEAGGRNERQRHPHHHHQGHIRGARQAPDRSQQARGGAQGRCDCRGGNRQEDPVARGSLEAADAAARRGGTRAGTTSRARRRSPMRRCAKDWPPRRSTPSGWSRSTSVIRRRQTRRKTFGQQTGLARHELINLGRQAQDVGVSLASGQSPFTVLVQQGSQIADVFATSRPERCAGSSARSAAGAARFLTSTAGIATGVAAIGTALVVAGSSYASAQREIEKGLSGIGAASGVTRDQINQIAEASSTAFGLSVSQAREAATAFAATGKIYEANVGQATKLIDDYVRAGGDATEMTKTLGAALQDPAKGALELNKAVRLPQRHHAGEHPQSAGPGQGARGAESLDGYADSRNPEAGGACRHLGQGVEFRDQCGVCIFRRARQGHCPQSASVPPAQTSAGSRTRNDWDAPESACPACKRR